MKAIVGLSNSRHNPNGSYSDRCWLPKEPVMAGRPGHPRVHNVTLRARKRGLHKALPLRAYRQRRTCLTRRRRGVDGRVKPGHDDEGPTRSCKKARPTGVAISAIPTSTTQPIPLRRCRILAFAALVLSGCNANQAANPSSQPASDNRGIRDAFDALGATI
jgi:hypothetical protein